jgi:hypothetical protein
MIPNISDTPENRFKLPLYLAALQKGHAPAEAAALAQSAWDRKQRVYHSWHAKLLGLLATIVFWGAVAWGIMAAARHLF